YSECRTPYLLRPSYFFTACPFSNGYRILALPRLSFIASGRWEVAAVANELRKTGISIVGDIAWGTHFCSFYKTTQDLLDILVPYFKAGLENNECGLCVISNSELLTVQEAISALRKAVPDLDRHLVERSIEVVGHDEWFLEAG